MPVVPQLMPSNKLNTFRTSLLIAPPLSFVNPYNRLSQRSSASLLNHIQGGYSRTFRSSSYRPYPSSVLGVSLNGFNQLLFRCLSAGVQSFSCPQNSSQVSALYNTPCRISGINSIYLFGKCLKLVCLIGGLSHPHNDVHLFINEYLTTAKRFEKRLYILPKLQSCRFSSQKFIKFFSNSLSKFPSESWRISHLSLFDKGL